MMNPILASSARRRMRSLRTPVIITLYGLMVAAFAWMQLSALNAPSIRLSTMRSGIDGYILILALQFFLTILISPAMTAGSISGERERQTLDLLLVTNTGAFRIVWGKLLESFAFVALMIFSTLPMLFLVLIPGGITVWQILTALLFMIVTAFGALSVGLLCSAIFRRTVAATVVAYLAVFAIGIGSLVMMSFEFLPVIRNMDYDMAALTTMSASQMFGLLPKAMFVNPGVGFLCLLVDQTMLLEGTFQMLPQGYWIYQAVSKVDFGTVAWINMAVVTLLSVLCTCVSALLVRPRRRIRVKKK